MKITIADLRYLSDTYNTNKQYKVKYKNRYWKWDNNKDKQDILISRDNKIWRSPKGSHLYTSNTTDKHHRV